MKEYLLENELISLLPTYVAPQMLLVGRSLPCNGIEIKSTPIKIILAELNRQVWSEGLFARKGDLKNIIRYKNADGGYKNSFDETQFSEWTKAVKENTAICEMENTEIGKGVFVPPGKKLTKNTFIPSSGIIKLNPTNKELATKAHCSALQDLNTRPKKIYGLIDPVLKGGILDLINHAPDSEETVNFKFKNSAIKNHVCTSNLKSIIKFYNGYAIMGVEAVNDIDGGEYGKQLLWSYARTCEYVAHEQHKSNNQTLCLFDNRNERNGKIINPNYYALRMINIFFDTGESVIKKVASITRWELMESPPETALLIAIEDPYSSNQTDAIPSSITHGFLQSYLQLNPAADRIIITVPAAELTTNLKKNRNNKEI